MRLESARALFLFVGLIQIFGVGLVRQGLRAATRHNVGHSVPSESVWMCIVERITFGPSGTPEKAPANPTQPHPQPRQQDLQSGSGLNLICL